MTPRTWLRALVLAVVLVTAPACTLTPRDLDSITDLDQTYSGYHRLPNDRLSIQFYNTVLSKWQAVAWVRSSSTAAHTDPCGHAWYPWQMDLTLPNPQSSPYWQFVGWFVFTRSRVVASSGDILRSFTSGSQADACIEQYECGQDILQNCGNSDGEIMLYCNDCY